MTRLACGLAAVLVVGSQALAWPPDPAPASPRKPPDGVYVVRRDGPREKDVRPLQDGEVLLVDRHRYEKRPTAEPPRFLVVRSAPEVALDLAREPKAVEEGGEVVRILLQLRPPAAAALERVTRDHLGRQVAIVLGGEVVTVHKVRAVIKGGDVQITSCAPGAAGYLLKQLQARQRNR